MKCLICGKEVPRLLSHWAKEHWEVFDSLTKLDELSFSSESSPGCALCEPEKYCRFKRACNTCAYKSSHKTELTPEELSLARVKFRGRF